MRLLRSHLAIASLVAALLSPASAWAVTIGFDALSSPGSFTGPVTEFDFTYSLHSGGLTVSTSAGNPAPELAGEFNIGGGTLSVVEQAGASFVFVGLDIAEFDNNNVGNSTITVEGFFSGSSVGAEMFTPTPTSGLGSYTTVLATGVLLGATIDELRVFLPSEGSNPFLSNARIDNVVLVPEPHAAGLLLLGLALLAGVRRGTTGRRFPVA